MQTTGGATPLMYACQQCRENDVLEILRKQPQSVRDRDRTLKTPLHYCAENPNSSCAEAILKTLPELVNAQDENGYCTLHLAVIAGNKPLIKLLITEGADVNIHDNEGHSAVHWAIVSSEKEALEMIIKAGANPSTPDIHGGYPLHYAVQMCGCNCDYLRNLEDTVRVVETLLNFGVDVNVKDKDGRQPILWAASAGSADAVIHLISGGACVEASDKDGLTALHCAASRGHTTTLETLISLCGANVDVIDGNGCSALFYSVTLGHADATELLLQLGAEPNRQDRKGRTPAHCGAAKGQLETLRILQKHGGNLWMRNVKGDIPLHEAVASGRKDLVLWLLSQCSDAINIANNDGRCPLHIASMYNNTEMVKILLDSKSLVNPVMRTSKGVLMTPLNVALSRGHRSCGKYLQLHGGVPFSKVSQIEPVSGLAIRISPSDDMMVTGEKEKENGKSSEIKISKSRSSTDIQDNQQSVKAESGDKKKVYRRRKKKKNPSNQPTQESDSDDSIHDLKIKTPDSRRSEKSNEDDDGNGHNEKQKKLKVHTDSKGVKKVTNARNASLKPKTYSNGRAEVSEDAVTEVTKSKTEAKSLQKNKSFNETKNVSDLSPEDFPPLMQTINQLDIVIMEPDADARKPETENNDSNPLEVGIVDPSNDSVAVETNEPQVKNEVLTNAAESPHEGKIQISDVEVEEKIVKENSEKQEKGVGAKKTSERSRTQSRNSDEGSARKSVKSPKSDGDSGKKNSKAEKKPEDSNNRKEPVKDSKTVVRPNAHETAAVKNDEVVESPPMETNTGVEIKEVEVKISKNETIAVDIPESNVEKSSEKVIKVETITLENTETEESTEPKTQNEITNLNSRTLEQSSIPAAENLTPALEDKQTKLLEMTNNTEKTLTEGKDAPEHSHHVIVPEEKDPSGNDDEPGGNGQLLPEVPETGVVETTLEKINPDETESKPALPKEEPCEVNNSRTIEKRSVEFMESTNEKQGIENKEEVGEGNLKSKNEADEPQTKEVESRRVKSERRNEEEEKEVEEKSEGGAALSGCSPTEHRPLKPPKVSRLCRRHRDFRDDMTQVSVTQLVQNTIRKYHMERGIFYQLLELKRYQIRSGRANEQVLVKRLADEYERSRVFLGMKPFSGLYKFREFEKFLYDQLKALNSRRSFIIPEVKSYDDIDALSGFLKKSRYKIISEAPPPQLACTCITQRCHHSACAYTSVPCSAYITDLRRHKHKQKKESFFPRIEQLPLKAETQKHKERPATLELIQGSEKHVITLPRNSPAAGKRYYVTFTIKGAPAFKEENMASDDSKDFLKHRHAKSV